MALSEYIDSPNPFLAFDCGGIVVGGRGQHQKGIPNRIFFIDKRSMMDFFGSLNVNLKDQRENQGMQVESTCHDKNDKKDGIRLVVLVHRQPKTGVHDTGGH